MLVSALNSIKFTSNEVGYIWSPDELFRSEDGGVSWYPLLPYGLNGAMLEGVFPLSDSVLYCYSASSILISQNGGRTFFRAEISNFSNFTAIDATLEGAGLFASFYNDSTTLYSTNNFGTSWQSFVPLGIDPGTKIIQLSYRRGGRTVALTSDNRFLSSTDGGRNWVMQYSFPSAGRVDFLSEEKVLFFSEGNLKYRSNDGGHTWMPVDEDSVGGLTSAIIHNGFTGDTYRLARSSFSPEFLVYKAKAGSEKWALEKVLRPSLERASFISDELGFVSLEYGTAKTMDGGVSWHLVKPSPTSGLPDRKAQLQMVDSLNGFSLGAALLRTKDGGTSWDTVLAQGTFTASSEARLFAINDSLYFLKDGSTLLRGNVSSRSAATPAGINDLQNVMSVTVGKTGYGIAVGLFGSAYLTFDAGRAWESIMVGTADNLYYSYVGEKVSIVAGDDDSLYRSFDGGVSWSGFRLANYSWGVKTFFFLNADIGFLTVIGGSSPLTYITRDAGLTWQRLDYLHIPDDITGVGDMRSLIQVGPFLLRKKAFRYLPNPKHLYGRTEVCVGQSADIRTPSFGPGTQYRWTFSGNPTVQSFGSNLQRAASWTAPGFYEVGIEVSNACGSSFSQRLVVHVQSFKPNIIANTNELRVKDGLDIVWYRNRNFAYAAPDTTGRRFTPSRSGMYTVSAKSQIGCEGISDPVEFFVDDYYCTDRPLSIAADDYPGSQWQIDRGNGYENLNDGVDFSATNTRVLRVDRFDPAMAGYKFRCRQIHPLFGTHFSGHARIRPGNRWIGTISTSWTNPGNWTCGKIPDEGTFVIIAAGTVELTQNTTVKGIEVLPGATLVVRPGVQLTIKP